jgi:hypothetical protein
VAVLVFAIATVLLFAVVIAGTASADPLSTGPTSPLPTPPPLPDWVVQRVEVDRSVPGFWQTRSVTVTVANTGEISTTKTVLLGVYEDREPSPCNDFGWDYAVVPGLTVGEAYTTTFAHPGFDDPGTHTLVALVDFACAVDESREDNNLAPPVTLELPGGRGYLPLVIGSASETRVGILISGVFGP